MAWEELTVRDVMTSPVTTVERVQSLHDAICVLTENGHSGAPVVNHRGEPVGVISLSDVAAFLAGLEIAPGKVGNYYLVSGMRLERGEAPRGDAHDLLRETAVSDVMTPQLISIGPDAKLRELLRLLIAEQVHRLLVLEDGVLCGVASATDVLTAIADDE